MSGYFGGGGGSGGTSLDAAQELAAQLVGAFGTVKPLWIHHFNTTTASGYQGLNVNCSDVDLAQAAPAASYYAGGASLSMERGYGRQFSGTVVTVENHAYVLPASTSTYYTKGPFIWASDWLWGESAAGLDVNRRFTKTLSWGNAHISDANINDAIDGSYFGQSVGGYPVGMVMIYQIAGSDAVFMTANGSAQEKTTLTGIDFFDDAWHDIAIYTDGTAWYAYVDGALYGGHTTKIPTFPVAPNIAATLRPAGPGLINDDTTQPDAGTFAFIQNYNIGLMGSVGSSRDDLIAALSSF